jgi:hypothetical protein
MKVVGFKELLKKIDIKYIIYCIIGFYLGFILRNVSYVIILYRDNLLSQYNIFNDFFYILTNVSSLQQQIFYGLIFLFLGLLINLLKKKKILIIIPSIILYFTLLWYLIYSMRHSSGGI